LSALHRGLNCGVLLVALSSGCGETGPPAAKVGPGGKPPPPRAGEDTMKNAMEKLMQKGKTIPGVPKSAGKRG
jgi:hypothetical protein